MTQQTQTSADFRWRVSAAGIEIYDGEDYLFTIPSHEFPVLLLNMVKVMRENTKGVD